MATSRRARSMPGPWQATFFVLVPLFRLYINKEMGLISNPLSASLVYEKIWLTTQIDDILPTDQKVLPSSARLYGRKSIFI